MARLRKYGVEATIDFDLFEVDGVDLRADWVPAQSDCEIMKDGGTSTQCSNTATDEGTTYSIILTATEMQAARLVLKIVDAATKVFLDHVVIIETYGNASAQHAMDLDEADGTQFVEAGGDGDQLTAINLPNQTMDIIGNITGNLSGSVGSLTGHTNQTADHTAGIAANQTDLNTIIADTNELQTDNIPGTLATIQTSTDRLTAVRAAVLTDLINDGRLDVILDAILADTAELQSDNIPGTLSTIQTSTDRLTAVRAAVLTDLIDGGRLDALIDLILGDTGELQSDDVPGLIAALNDLSAANVNTEVSDVLKTDTVTLPGQVAPPLTPTFEQMLAHLYKNYRNRKDQTSTLWRLFADNETTVDQQATVSDDNTTAIKQEIIQGV